MSGDAVVVEGKEYVSVKRAADTTGYSRDYIGQMARQGLISAQRIGGLWYVSPESLDAYQKNASELPRVQQAQRIQHTSDAIVSLDGKDYISASRAASITGYNQDYIGQLARAGKVLSRQIGNRWYIERAALLAHKAEKDALLAGVQSESVGLVRPFGEANKSVQPEIELMTYIKESERPLMPAMGNNFETNTQADPFKAQVTEEGHSIPIRIQQRPIPSPISTVQIKKALPARRVRQSGKTMSVAVKSITALTFVIVISYGVVTLKDSSLYASLWPKVTTTTSQNALIGSLSDALEPILSRLESLLVEEIIYTRGQ